MPFGPASTPELSQLAPLAQLLADKLKDIPAVLLAVSGGADSIALLRAAAEVSKVESIRVEVGYFQHHLRGAASLADEQFVVDLCRQFELPCHLGQANWSQTLPSEQTARDQRYAFLKQTCQQRGLTTLLTGHHADDQVETVLYHLLRGTGLAGLGGMSAQRLLGSGITLLRPFLEVAQGVLLAYLEQLEQPFRVDESNLSSEFTRNRVRNELLPLLKTSFNPQVESAVLRLSEQAREVHNYLQQVAGSVFAQAVLERDSNRCRLLAKPLYEQPDLIRREVFVLVWTTLSWPRQRMGAKEWQKLSDSVGKSRCSFDLPGPIHVARRGELLVLTSSAPAMPKDCEQAVKYQ